MNNDNTDIYASFWIYLSYFFSFICLVFGYGNNYQNWIYYGLFFIILGLLMGANYRLNKLLGAYEEDDEYMFYEDSD